MVIIAKFGRKLKNLCDCGAAVRLPCSLTAFSYYHQPQALEVRGMCSPYLDPGEGEHIMDVDSETLDSVVVVVVANKKTSQARRAQSHFAYDVGMAGGGR